MANTLKTNLQRIRENLEQGLLPQWIVTDPEIYQLEQEKVFSKTWHFLAHESELKEPGSFVTRWIVHDPILVVKTEKGEIKAFLNSCSHRGVQLCTADCGQKKTFVCPYHGWSFNLEGKLIGITQGDKLYGEEMDKEEWGLRPVPRLESYKGLIFANLDKDAPPLKEYLGDMTWYLDILLGRSDGGMEVRGTPQRWKAPGNWKSTYENFTGDPYHVQYTHRSTVEMGITPKHVNRRGYQIVLGNGHGINVTMYEGELEHPYQRMPQSMWPMFKKNLNPIQHEIAYRASVLVGGIFPTLSFVSPVHSTDGRSFHNYLSLRVWRPVGPEEIEIWSWFLIDKLAPEEYKEEAYRGYIASFGPAGTLEQDDTVNWGRIVSANRGLMVRDRALSYNNFSNYLMGMEKVKPAEDFPGPGTAYPGLVDTVSRSIYEYWLKLMGE